MKGLEKFSRGYGELYDVGSDAGGVGAGGDFGAAAVKRFEFPVVEGVASYGNVVAAVAVLRFTKGLNDLRRGQLVRDLRKIERVTASRIASRKRECSDGIHKIARRRVNVQWR